MKYSFLLSCLTCIAWACQPKAPNDQSESTASQQVVQERTHDTVIGPFGGMIITARESARVIKTTPSPLGGMDAFLSAVQGHLVYPESARRNQIEGTVGIIIEILPDSSIAIFTVDGMGHGTEEASVEAIMSTKTTWIPSINEKTGEPVSARLLIPVEFRLAGD